MDGRKRAWRASFVFGAGGLAALACLDDLPPLPPIEADAPATLSACGDGLVETLDDGGDAGESCDPGEAGATIGCEACALRCSGVLDGTGHCYFLAGRQEEYPDAVEACAGAAAHVVTIASAREAALAEQVTGGQPYWVGLSQSGAVGGYGAAKDDEPGWPASGACPGCFAIGADDAGRFEPLPDAGTNPGCLVAAEGRWRAAPCTGGPHLTLCEREPAGQRAFFCGGPYCTTLASTAGTKRYVFGPSTSAEEASRFCEENYAGGRLVVLRSSEERAELVREIAGRFGPGFTAWIGLSRRDGGAWLWDDGTAEDAGALPWGDRQPAPPARAFERAYVRVEGFPRVDNQLAESAGPERDGGRVAVCQRPLP